MQKLIPLFSTLRSARNKNEAMEIFFHIMTIIENNDFDPNETYKFYFSGPHVDHYLVSTVLMTTVYYACHLLEQNQKLFEKIFFKLLDSPLVKIDYITHGGESALSFAIKYTTKYDPPEVAIALIERIDSDMVYKMITKRLDSSDNDYHSLPAYGTPLMVAVKQDNNKVLSELVKKLNLDDIRKLLRDILRRRKDYELNTYRRVVKKDYEYNPEFIYKLLNRLPIDEASEIIDKMKLENREVGRFPEIDKMVQQRDAVNTRYLSKRKPDFPEDTQDVITKFLNLKGGKRKFKTNKRKSRRNKRKTHYKINKN